MPWISQADSCPAVLTRLYQSFRGASCQAIDNTTNTNTWAFFVKFGKKIPFSGNSEIIFVVIQVAEVFIAHVLGLAALREILDTCHLGMVLPYVANKHFDMEGVNRISHV